MSKVTRGKQFEEQIRKNFMSVHDTAVYRLQDSMGGYAGVANICDFIVYKYPTQYFIECKTHYGTTLPFSCITENQWHGLFRMSKIKGVQSGILVWFMDYDVTYYVPIQDLQRLRDNGSKSLHVKWCSDHAFLIKGKKKRILFDYDFSEFFKKFSK